MQNFDEIWNSYYPKLRIYGRSFSGLSDADREDCIQEVFLKIHRGLASYDRRWALSTWIYRIARNCFIDFQRAQKRHQWEELDSESLTGGFGPAENHQNKTDTATDLRRALDELPDAQREALYLCYGEALSVREIAKVLRKPEGTVKSLLARGRERMARTLEADYA